MKVLIAIGLLLVVAILFWRRVEKTAVPEIPLEDVEEPNYWGA